MAATLPKEERLSGRTAIATLMGRGRWEHTSHLRCCYLKDNGTGCNRIMVSVPKKNFKRAVKRNLLKRRMRESYRTQKELLLSPGHDILFVYTDKEVADSGTIRSELALLLGKIASR